MRKIAIRIDDVTSKMDWERFNQFADILDKYGIKPLIGVVPQCKDSNLNVSAEREDYSAFLKARCEAGWTIAMHGFDHCYVTKNGGLFGLNDFSEFAGLSYEEQFSKLIRGKKALEELGLTPKIFMAPAHSYDLNTLKALKECGFTHVTDGFGKKPYVKKGLIFLPISIRRSAELSKKDGYTTFVIHTMTMNDEEMQEYDIMFEKYRNHFIDYSELLGIEAQKRNVVMQLWERGLARLKHAITKLL